MGKLGWIIPVAITGTLLIAVGGVYLSIMDLNKSSFKPETITTDQVLQRQVVRSLSPASTEKKIDYTIDQKCLNQIFYNATESIRKDPKMSQYIGDFYVEIKGNNYKFFIEANLKIIQTRFIIDTKLKETDTDYIFHVESIKAGNFPAKWLIDMTGVTNNLPLESTFTDMGLNIKVDLNNSQLTYAKADMQKDLLDLMSSKAGSGDDSLLSSTLDTMDLKFEMDKGIHVTGDLSNMQNNDEASDASYDTETGHYEDAEAIKKLIEDGVKSATEDSINGKSEEEIKSSAEFYFKQIKHLGSSDGVNSVVEQRIKNTNTPATYVNPGEYKVAYIGEDELDQILIATDVIGKSYILHYADEVAYVVVDNFYCDLFQKDGKAYLNYTLGININGLETRAIIETECQPVANSFKANFKISNIYYGSKVAKDKFQKVVKDFFSDAINSMDDSSWVSFDKENNVIAFNFDKLFEKDELVPYQVSFDAAGGGTKSLHIDKDNVGLGGEGQLSLHFARE